MSLSTMGRTALNLCLVAAIPVMLGAKGKCRRAPPDVDTDTVVTDPVQSVEVALQVVSASPSTVQPATPTPMKVYGAGFEQGATVGIGAFRVSPVTVVDPNTLSFTAPGLSEGTHDLIVTNPDGKSSSLKGAIRAVGSVDDSCAQMAMYFDLDSATLSGTARSALESAMPCLKGRSLIRLEGHADERGTTDYNLALGQRRAEAVMRYLVNNGVPPNKLPIVSYGEERPADPSHSEAAWAKNRRVDMRAQ
ncbi:MAG: OmpA family protein [Alphaproteobacteria bacterium]|nr:OmpA family protein [Alphaproteobacteria bacterium]